MNATSHPRTTPPACDFIGDIHGYHAKLLRLLDKLGYRPAGESFRHPQGRKVVFLGDYIDRGPEIRETLRTVRAMVDNGDALAIMGNHEWNALNYHHRGRDGEWLRRRTDSNTAQHAATLRAFDGREKEWAGWLEWMAQLPFALDLGGARAVHAVWDAEAVESLRGRSFADRDFLLACGERDTAESRAMFRLLKGIEFRLPPDAPFHDKEGVRRNKGRARWWLENVTGVTCRNLAFPDYAELPHLPVEAARLPDLPGYGPTEPPCFFGHYWVSPENAPAPVGPNLACLDYSAAKSGPLVAYRWNGESTLAAEHFTAVL